MTPRLGVNEARVSSMFDFREEIADGVMVCWVRSVRRADLPFWVQTREDGAHHVPDAPTES